MEKQLPTCRKSNTVKELPILAIAYAESELPNLTKDRKASAEPRCAKSSTEQLCPTRTKRFTESVEASSVLPYTCSTPILAWSLTLSESPTVTLPKVESFKPSRAKPRKLSEDPMCT
jgi:hypothetical protein